MKTLRLLCAVLLCTRCLAQSPCSPLTYPDLPPWDIANPTAPWDLDTTYAGETVSVRAYLKYRCNPAGDSLRKPFVFVEGIDFNLDAEPLRCGDFGWEAFIGTSPDYPMLYNMPTLVNALRDEGYDIILVDFADGAADLRANAEALQAVLVRIRQWTAGDQPLVLAGASMGGQITRYTLATMEEAGLPHCCRLWISLDAPHTGANIPLGLQHCLDFLAEPVLNLDNAQQKLTQTLHRPAARQLLRDQLPGAASLYTSFYEEMEALGYPQSMRKVGVANGAMDATPVAIAPGSSLFDYEITFPITEETVMHLQAFAAPGNAGQVFDGTAPISFVPVYDANPCTWLPESVVTDAQSMPAGSLALDHAPGGRRNTITELVLEINAGIASSGCATDTIANFQSVHSFIPTASALGVDDAYLFSPLGQALANDPGLSPFDVTHGPMGSNEWHSEVSSATAQLLMREVLAGENPLPALFDQGLFTFRDSASYLVYDVEVTGTAQLHVHGGEAPHWGTSPSGTTTPLGGHFNLVTNPCGSHLEVHDGGQLLLGHAASGSTANLHLRDGSLLELGPQGLLEIRPGSQLVVESGATLRLEGGMCRVLPGAEIHIHPGARLEIEGGQLQLEGPEGGLFLGGTCLLATGTTFAPLFQDQLAPIHITHPVELEVLGETGLLLEGAHPQNTALTIQTGASLTLPAGLTHFRMQDAKVTLGTGALLVIACHAHHRNATVSCPTQDCAGLTLLRDAYIQDCLWEELPTNALLTSGLLRMLDCTVSGESGHLFVKGRTYDIEDTDFSGSQGISSQALEFDARLRVCTFLGTGVIGNAEAVSDHSEQALFVQGCHFDDCIVGLAKHDGELHVQCSTFGGNDSGMVLTGDAQAYLDPLHGGGYNHFHHNTTALEISGAPLPILADGYNRWEQETHEHLITGWTPGSCDGICSALVPATHNTWSETWESAESGPSGPAPLPEKFNVWRTDSEYGCAGNPFGLGCEMIFGDQGPVSATACLNWVPKPGLNRNSALANVHIAPNPSAGQAVLINTGTVAVEILAVRSVSGQACAAVQSTLDAGMRLSLPQLKPGVYFVEVLSGGSLAYVCWVVAP